MQADSRVTVPVAASLNRGVVVRVLSLIVVLLLPRCAGSDTDSHMGSWEVTDAKFPGISAMGMSEAREWFGATAVYSASAVTFREERCGDPRFERESLTEEDFRRSYRATFADLDIESPLVEVLHVGCPSNWVSPASTFLQSDRDTGYILWDGVFFKLERVAR